MQFVNLGGSLGTITGAPGLCAAWLLAATYIQWSNARVVIGLPATSATESTGTPLPHAASATETTKKAPSAANRLTGFLIGAHDGSDPARSCCRSFTSSSFGPRGRPAGARRTGT